MKVSLAIYNGTGVSADIEVDDTHGLGEGVTIVEGYSYTAKKACKAAAQKLRILADRFDALAEEKEPFNDKTQARINRQINRKTQKNK